MKIFIFGASGSGKSTFANNVSKILNISSFNLDDIYWKRKYDLCRNCLKRNILLNNILKNKNWIIEGVYTSWTQKAVSESDIVIILNPSRFIIIYRLIKRFIKDTFIFRINRKNSFKSLKLLLKYSYLYNTKKTDSNFYTHVNMAKEYSKKYVVLRNKKEINSFLSTLKKH